MTKQTDQINAMIELNDELENYFRNTIIPQLFVDANFILRKFTPPAMKQFRLHDTDIGKTIADIRDNLRFTGIVEHIQQVMDTGMVMEKEVQTTDMRWFQMNILPYIIQKQQRTNGVIITFIEITRRIQDLKDLEKLIKEHELLLDTISHDIKTPLTSLGLTIEMLKKVPEKGMERFPLLLEKVEHSLFKMQHIIQELTDTRQAEHRYAAVDESLNFEHIVEDVRLSLAPQLLASGASIETEIHHSEIVFVRRKLRSILHNLMGNAIKYKAEDKTPKIKIITQKEGDMMLIAVSDNGLGIAEKDFEKIFGKYQRLSTKVEGSGVGLYLVKEIVDMAGGRITVESEVGVGSTFKVYLKLGQ